MTKIAIRNFHMEDSKATYRLFYETVHEININDYTQEQIDKWAPKNQPPNWGDSLAANYTFIAEDCSSNCIIGFADMDKNGYLNRGYVHKDFQRKGIGKQLLQVRETKAKELGLIKTFSDVSITAKPFFEKMGYSLVKEQEKVIDKVVFINYYMEKIL